MPHLSAERLAALADAGELPAAVEADHLAQCDDCAAERLTYAALVAGAAEERRTIAEPLTTWEGIAAGLRAEGLLGATRPAALEVTGRARSRFVHVGARAAAAVLLLAAGVVAGRMSVSPASASVEPAGDARTPIAELLPDYQTTADAEAALERFEVAYQHAAAYLAGNDTSARLDAADDYRTRLVALDRAGRTMRDAMEEAPYDPVLAGYYLTTLGQREATLRQLNVAVPAGARLNSF